MPTYFFDTSALQHRYMDGVYSRRVRRIISGKNNYCFIADLTVLEIASALASQCRTRELTHKNYDRADNKFWGDISAEFLLTRKASDRDIMRARYLLRFAGVIRKRKLGSVDALIAVSALELALERKERIIFYTSDWTQFDILRQIDAYASVLRLRFVGIPKVPLTKK